MILIRIRTILLIRLDSLLTQSDRDGLDLLLTCSIIDIRPLPLWREVLREISIRDMSIQKCEQQMKSSPAKLHRHGSCFAILRSERFPQSFGCLQ